MNLYSELKTRQEIIIERIENNCNYLMMSADMIHCNVDECLEDVFNDYLKHKSKLNNKQLENLKESLLNAFEYTRDNNVEEDEDTIELINQYINQLTSFNYEKNSNQ
jgi:hypothetical protein